MAKLANRNIKTIIITTGANDILQDHATECSDSAFGDSCKKAVDRLAATIDTMFKTFAADGVKSVVYVTYLYGAGGGTFNKVMDYAMGLVHTVAGAADGRGGMRVKVVDP